MTTISSISSDCSKAAIVCSMIGLPATLISCLGMLKPTRVPVPPAKTTATLRRLTAADPPRSSAGEPSEPTVDLLRHRLAGQRADYRLQRLGHRPA